MDPITVIQIGILAYGGINAIYHRWKTRDETWPLNAGSQDRLKIPVTAEGSPVPMLFGQCRVRAPVLAWYGNVETSANPYIPDSYFYEADLLFVLGIPATDGSTLLQGIFIGEKKIDNAGNPHDKAPNPGNPGSENVVASLPSTNPEFTQLFYEYMDGNTSQDFTATHAADRMITAGIDATLTPGFHGQATVFARISRNQPSLPVIGYELSTYPLFSVGPGTQRIGNEANPVDVLYNLLIGAFGKLGLPNSMIDVGSFAAAAYTLYTENHGYSRCIEDRQTASDIIEEILRQIDGVMYMDQVSQTIKIKLVRADFNPTTIPRISPANCDSLQFTDAGGRTNLYNKVRVVFSDRSQGYADGSATAHNSANYFGQNEEAAELVLQFPGVCTQGLANIIAGRELAARSRPLLKCRATVDRSFLRVAPGDAVALDWPEANIIGRTMRVGAVSFLDPDSNSMQLDLVEDFFFVHRYEVSPDVAPSFPPAA